MRRIMETVQGRQHDIVWLRAWRPIKNLSSGDGGMNGRMEMHDVKHTKNK